MNKRFKDFGAGVGSDVPAEPLSFKLHNEEFECVPKMQGKVLLGIVESSGSDDASESAKTIRTIFEHVLTDESFKRFDSLLDDKEKIVSVETLSEIVSWLLEEYSNRPEKQPEA
jgi:hypothetical protein